MQATVESGTEPARVLLVDDHPLFRDALCHLFERDPALTVVAQVGSAQEALEIVRTQTIDLAVIDIVLPLGDGDGVRLTQQIRSYQPRCVVLGLSVHNDPSRIAAMIRAGASGFACKTQPGPEILTAIRSVLAANSYLPPAFDSVKIRTLADTSESSPLERLTNREREVYELLVSGQSNERVATKLLIARRTVETHRQNIMKKLQVNSIAELVRLSFQLNS